MTTLDLKEKRTQVAEMNKCEVELQPSTCIRKRTAEERVENFLEHYKSKKLFWPRKQKLQHRLQQSILDLTRWHRLRRETENICRGHYYLFTAIRVCYESRLDYSFLSDLIKDIFLCDRSLVAIFSITLPVNVLKLYVNNDVPVLYPEFSKKNISFSVYQSFEYYLQNLSEVKLANSDEKTSSNLINAEFDFDGEYLPIMAAVKRKDPQLVHLLLRYGADPTMGSFSNPSVNSIDILVSNLNGIYSCKNSSMMGKLAKVTLKEEERKCLLCLKFIGRCVANITFSQETFFDTEIKNADLSSPKVYNLHKDLDKSQLVARLNRVCSLQHLCRLAIRKRIQSASPRNLPVTIKQLPITNVMKCYLDLQF